jgi:hypothetical protein
MKKIFLIALLGGVAGNVQAQTAIKAGTIQLGGSIGYARSSQETPSFYPGGTTYYPSTLTTTTSQFGIAPAAGYFVADNLALGISGAYQVTHYVNSNNITGQSSDRKSTLFKVGVFGQYYKMLTEQFGLTGTLGGGYQSDGRPYGYDSGDLAGKGAYANLTPSIVFFPIPKLAIGASIGGLDYSYFKIKADGSSNNPDYKKSDFGANFGLSQLLFSGTFYFGR